MAGSLDRPTMTTVGSSCGSALTGLMLHAIRPFNLNGDRPMPISSYLKSVREKVGHDLLTMMAVSISIFDEGAGSYWAEMSKWIAGPFPEAPWTPTNSPRTQPSENALKRRGFS
jgi:hypothetical protein